MAGEDVSVQFTRDTALIVVDVQNDFADPKGGLYVSDGEQVVPTVNRLIDEARRAGAPVIFTQDWHPETTPHFQKDGGTWPVHCVQGTWGAELHPDLDVPDDAPIVKKGSGGEDGYSGFTVRDPESGEDSPTELEGLLRERGVERVVVVGLAQDVCVKETTLDACRLGFTTIVPGAATRAVGLEEGDAHRAAEAMRRAGAEVL